MGWSGKGPLNGDDGMDLRDEVFAICGIDGSRRIEEDYSSTITSLLVQNQYVLYDWIRDYPWENTYNPGLVQQFWIQALMQLFLNYDVPISERGKRGALPFIAADYWAIENEERAEAMERLKRDVENQDVSVPYQEVQ